MNLLSGADIYCPLSVLERVRIIEVFFICMGILPGPRELSVIERCLY